MTEVASNSLDVSSPWRWRRLWFLVVVDTLAVLGIVAVWFVLPDRVDLGARRMITFMIVAVALVAVAAWFFFMARLPRRTRLVAALVLGTAGIAGGRVDSPGGILRRHVAIARFPLVQRSRRRAGRTPRAAACRPGQPGGSPSRGAAVDRPAEWDVLEYRGPQRDGVVPGPKLRTIGASNRRSSCGGSRWAAATRPSSWPDRWQSRSSSAARTKPSWPTTSKAAPSTGSRSTLPCSASGWAATVPGPRRRFTTAKSFRWARPACSPAESWPPANRCGPSIFWNRMKR